MADSLASKLAELGLDRRGVLSPAQKGALAAQEASAALPAEAHVPAGSRACRGIVLETRVAGTSGIEDYEAVVGELEPADRLSIRLSGPDAGGAVAPEKLALYDRKGRVVGYVPHDDAPELAALVMAGEALYARVLGIDAHRDWADISIDICRGAPAPHEGEGHARHAG